MRVKYRIKSVIISALRSIQALLLKLKYRHTLSRLRTAYGNRKIIVAFCVSEIAKWKSQSLYDALSHTDKYYPIIYIYPSPLELNYDSNNIDLYLKEKVIFFKHKKMNVINLWNKEDSKCIIPKDIHPDILFYQQPWDVPPFPLPSKLANIALSFYIPYYLVNNIDLGLEYGHLFHRQLYGYIVQNELIANLYTSSYPRMNYAGNCLPLGHTIIDSLSDSSFLDETNSVIYAPHFSFPVLGVNRVLTYSTFLENGKLILEYAKQHPEINWVFKPHPKLKWELENTGVWTTEEIDSYYGEWAKIGIVCTTSDYVKIFQSSFAMITDCGSFLTEYSCLDKPLIRLYYYSDNLPPNPVYENLYKTFYYAHNNAELVKLLNDVICKKLDPHQSARHHEITALGLAHSSSANKIVKYFDSLLSSNSRNSI